MGKHYFLQSPTYQLAYNILNNRYLITGFDFRIVILGTVPDLLSKANVTIGLVVIGNCSNNMLRKKTEEGITAHVQYCCPGNSACMSIFQPRTFKTIFAEEKDPLCFRVLCVVSEESRQLSGL